jgi:hypothetical protein
LIEYIVPKQIGERLERARGLLILYLDAAANGLATLQKQRASTAEEEIQRKWKLLYNLIDQAVTRIYFAADINPGLRQGEEPLDDEIRLKFFRESLPVLEKVLNFGKQPDTGLLLAPTAHHFMEMLNGVLRYDPALILRLATEVVETSKRFGYNLDPMAMEEIVKLVESVLADYRDSVQEDTAINNLLAILDAFVEAGWPEALNLVWRLDEIYR